jgi:hypothetical protein
LYGVFRLLADTREPIYLLTKRQGAGLEFFGDSIFLLSFGFFLVGKHIVTLLVGIQQRYLFFWGELWRWWAGGEVEKNERRVDGDGDGDLGRAPE